jgi:archaellum component FlaC
MEALGQFAASVDSRFDAIDDRFETIDRRFEGIEKHLFTQDEHIANLESDMSGVKQKVDHIYNILDDHMKRIETILQENQVQKYQ